MPGKRTRMRGTGEGEGQTLSRPAVLGEGIGANAVVFLDRAQGASSERRKRRKTGGSAGGEEREN